MTNNVVDFEVLKRKKDAVPEGLYDEILDKEDFIIDMHQSNEALKSSVDELWNQLYISKKVSNMFADEDGRIHYSSRWVSSMKLDPDYERNLEEHLKITMNFVNNNSLSATFMKFYEDEIAKMDLMRLLILHKENTTSL